MKPARFFLIRILTLFLILSIAPPPPTLALRNETTEGAGLEEDLTHSLQNGNPDAAFKTVTRQLGQFVAQPVPSVPGTAAFTAGLEERELLLEYEFDKPATRRKDDDRFGEANDLAHRFIGQELAALLKKNLIPDAAERFLNRHVTSDLSEAFTNAIYHGRQARVEIYRTREREQEFSGLLIRISNTGPGMSDPNQPLIKSIRKHELVESGAFHKLGNNGFRVIVESADGVVIESRGKKWEGRKSKEGNHRFVLLEEGTGIGKETVVSLIYRDFSSIPGINPWKDPPAAGMEESSAEGTFLLGRKDGGNELRRGRLSERGVPGAGPSNRSTEQPSPGTRQTKLPHREPTSQLPFQIPPLAVQGQRKDDQHNVQSQSHKKSPDLEILAEYTAQHQPPQHRVTGVNRDLQQGVALLGSKPQHVSTTQKSITFPRPHQSPNADSTAAGMEENFQWLFPNQEQTLFRSRVEQLLRTDPELRRALQESISGERPLWIDVGNQPESRLLVIDEEVREILLRGRAPIPPAGQGYLLILERDLPALSESMLLQVLHQMIGHLVMFSEQPPASTGWTQLWPFRWLFRSRPQPSRWEQWTAIRDLADGMGGTARDLAHALFQDWAIGTLMERGYRQLAHDTVEEILQDLMRWTLIPNRFDLTRREDREALGFLYAFSYLRLRSYIQQGGDQEQLQRSRQMFEMLGEDSSQQENLRHLIDFAVGEDPTQRDWLNPNQFEAIRLGLILMLTGPTLQEEKALRETSERPASEFTQRSPYYLFQELSQEQFARRGDQGYRLESILGANVNFVLLGGDRAENVSGILFQYRTLEESWQGILRLYVSGREVQTQAVSGADVASVVQLFRGLARQANQAVPSGNLPIPRESNDGWKILHDLLTRMAIEERRGQTTAELLGQYWQRAYPSEWLPQTSPGESYPGVSEGVTTLLVGRAMETLGLVSQWFERGQPAFDPQRHGLSLISLLLNIGIAHPNDVPLLDAALQAANRVLEGDNPPSQYHLILTHATRAVQDLLDAARQKQVGEFPGSAAGMEEKGSKRSLEDLIEDSKGPLAQAVRQGQRTVALVDPLMTGASVEELAAVGDLFADRLRDLSGYPVVQIKPLLPGAAEAYWAKGYQVVQLKMAPREIPIDPNTVYVQLPFGSDRLIPVKFLPLVVTEAIARWQRAQGAVLTSPIILPAAPYLNAAGLSLDDIWDILSARFA